MLPGAVSRGLSQKDFMKKINKANEFDTLIVNAQRRINRLLYETIMDFSPYDNVLLNAQIKAIDNYIDSEYMRITNQKLHHKTLSKIQLSVSLYKMWLSERLEK